METPESPPSPQPSLASLPRDLVQLATAVATGAAMLSATPSQAIPDDAGCNIVTALDMETGEYTECGYCQLWDSPICIYDCDNGDSGWFIC